MQLCPPVTSADVCSKMEVIFLLIDCLLLSLLFVGVWFWSLAFYSELSVLSSFANILIWKRELVDLL